MADLRDVVAQPFRAAMSSAVEKGRPEGLRYERCCPGDESPPVNWRFR